MAYPSQARRALAVLSPLLPLGTHSATHDEDEEDADKDEEEYDDEDDADDDG